ncbi:MAG: aminopeptidase P family protein [Acidobacteria bacterium]|nr:aminopeptidase P family protein [Acidobacteriota bacterium]
MPDSMTRHRQWLKSLEANQLDGFLIGHPPNLFYLFRFSGSTGLACCLAGECYLIVDSRYIEQATSETCDCHPLLAEKSLVESLRTLLEKPSWSGKPLRIGVEAQHIPWEQILRLQSWKTTIEWVPTSNLIEELRMIKDAEEISLMQEAFRMAQQAYRQMKERVYAGMKEIDVAGILEFELRQAGGQGLAFETIVASGPRSSLPHAASTVRTIGEDEYLLIDFGLKYQGYCSDLTRIHPLSKAVLPDIFEVVQEAQKEALSRIRPGVCSSDIDAAARQVISRYGYGDHFGHGTGHGLGLEVHELPSLSALKPQEIQEGMTFTVEPGIYLPEEYGIRIEDVVAVTENGYSALSDPSI